MIASLQAGRSWRLPAALGLGAVGIEWARVTLERTPLFSLSALALGGVALCFLGLGFRPHELGLGLDRIPARVLGGAGLAVVLLLPTALRSGPVPLIPPPLALAAVLVSVGEEVAFRGALFAALHRAGGGAVAVAGSTLAFTAAHVLSHPPTFLPEVAAMGLLLSVWRWAFADLVAPALAHTIADLGL